MKKNNAWNIRRLVDESFVPSTQRIILKIFGFLVSSFELKGLSIQGWADETLSRTMLRIPISVK